MKKFGLLIVFLSIVLIVGCGDSSSNEDTSVVEEQELRLTDAIPENPVTEPATEGVFTVSYTHLTLPTNREV